jgi:hypothetical protein
MPDEGKAVRLLAELIELEAGGELGAWKSYGTPGNFCNVEIQCCILFYSDTSTFITDEEIANLHTAMMALG